MKVLPLRLTLQEPVLAAALAGDPNSATTYPFIPGSLIRGALATRYLEEKQSKVSKFDFANDVEARRLFLSETTRFLNAYPVYKEGPRVLPTPLSWAREKEEEPFQTIYDLSATANGAKPVQARGLSQPFCRLVGDQVELLQPERRFNVHTRREDRQMGRATEQAGAVFRYEALAARQVFDAVIICEKDDDVTTLSDLLSQGFLQLGGSRSAGYGQVTVSVGQPQSAWREVNHPIQDIPAGQSFTLTLLSDLLVRDKCGQYITTITRDLIADWLGLGSVQIVDIFRATGLTGGFNRKWGLPLPQVPVIRAGTVFVLRAGESVSTAQITRLENSGVGLHREEGLGRLAINWHGDAPRLKLLKPVDESVPEAEKELSNTFAPLDEDSQRIAKIMATRLLRHRVDNYLAEYLHERQIDPRGIRPSQPARLRTLVRGALAARQLTVAKEPGQDKTEPSEFKDLLEWLAELRPKARKQFEAARVDSSSLAAWLQARLTNRMAVWSELGLAPEEVSLIAFYPSRHQLKAQLADEVTLRLIDGVLAKVMKVAKEAANNE